MGGAGGDRRRPRTAHAPDRLAAPEILQRLLGLGEEHERFHRADAAWREGHEEAGAGVLAADQDLDQAALEVLLDRIARLVAAAAIRPATVCGLDVGVLRYGRGAVALAPPVRSQVRLILREAVPPALTSWDAGQMT